VLRPEVSLAVEEILPNIYRVEVPLPNSPLKALNSYVIKAEGRSLVIDTGLNRAECMDEMLSSLGRLNVDLERTDFLITHLHADHLGLVASLATATSRVHFNHKEVSIRNSPVYQSRWPGLAVTYKSHGFPGPELNKALESNPGRIYGLKQKVDFRALKEGDIIDIGDYSFRCLETPGHSPGHTCLYEASKRILISGDHILFDITPNITFWPEMQNPLKDYLESLDKVYTLDVALVLPGHRNIWHDHRGRITELKEHHQARLYEVLDALADGNKTAFQVAPSISWDIEYSSWEQFPPTQKWFAVGETIAHLHYLEENRTIERRINRDKIVFSLA
jgi:glyoxylase-like metal-dependent hydrolase (beta-lactamase superfamily II)